ncbi:hypothetical protein KIPB_000989 [Kipferlia bialata]|uniref:Kelch-type beta propeller n=1 Tax=Kipferlia bialata TaxID=797122 RepID=A0A391NIH3_9EUKA|nr:hypothetical protein KIPB_000989 [Kipferlia bialata]|eukprot:g989.t1
MLTIQVCFEHVSDPQKSVSSMSVTRVGESVYLFGGSTDNTFHSQTDTLQAYDIPTGEWRLIPKGEKGEGEWPLGRHGHNAFSLGGNLHIMAGVLCDMAYGKPTLEHWVYTPSTETWRLVGEVPIWPKSKGVVVNEVYYQIGKGAGVGYHDPFRMYTYTVEGGWVLDPVPLRFIEPDGLRARGSDLCVYSRGDLHVCDTATGIWRQVPEEEYTVGRDQWLERLGHETAPSIMLSVKNRATDMDTWWSEWHY